jgi:hypothetical protein
MKRTKKMPVSVTVDEYKAMVRESWSEKQFQAAFIALARSLGWEEFHPPTIGGRPKDFPDEVLKRGPGYAMRVVVVELKVKNRKPTPEQLAWLAAFEAMGVPAYLWYPSQWTEIVEVLSGDHPCPPSIL